MTDADVIFGSGTCRNRNAAALEIDTTAPLDGVVRTILHHGTPSNRDLKRWNDNRSAGRTELVCSAIRRSHGEVRFELRPLGLNHQFGIRTGQPEASGRIGSPNQEVPERVTIEREALFRSGTGTCTQSRSLSNGRNASSAAQRGLS